MRTVTFSDLSIARRVHESFVPVWVNAGPGFHDCEGAAEASIWTAEPEVFPTRNIATFFATPDFRVLHYVAGYWHPDFFAKELEFAAGFRGLLFREDGRLRPDAIVRFRRAHRDREKAIEPVLAYFEAEKGWAAALGPDPVHASHEHGPACQSNLVGGLRHLSEVHRSFGRSARSNLPKLSALFSDYLYGNSFAEGDHKLARDGDLFAAMRGK